MKRLLPLVLLLGIATLPRLAFAEGVKVLFELPAPFTTDVRWFPDGRHLLLAHCAGEFGEKEEGNLPYGVCSFLVFDTRTKRSIPVKRASSRGDWQDPNLLHLAVADGSNCLWAVSPGGELFIRALPRGSIPYLGWPDKKGRWIVVSTVHGFYLYRYDPRSDRYYEAGPYPDEDPLDYFIGDGEVYGRRGGTFLIPFSNPYSPERDLALVWDADYVPFEGFYDGPRYEEVSLIRTSDRQRLYRVGGDRVLVSFGWDPRPSHRRLALLVAPRDPEGVFDPRRRRLVVLEVAAAGKPPGLSHTGSQTLINFGPSDYAPGACR
ncbi:hypothetical protein [Oceanithermus sp.]